MYFNRPFSIFSCMNEDFLWLFTIVIVQTAEMYAKILFLRLLLQPRRNFFSIFEEKYVKCIYLFCKTMFSLFIMHFFYFDEELNWWKINIDTRIENHKLFIFSHWNIYDIFQWEFTGKCRKLNNMYFLFTIYVSSL